MNHASSRRHSIIFIISNHHKVISNFYFNADKHSKTLLPSNLQNDGYISILLFLSKIFYTKYLYNFSSSDLDLYFKARVISLLQNLVSKSFNSHRKEHVYIQRICTCECSQASQKFIQNV